MATTLTVGQELEGRILDTVHRTNTFTLEALKGLFDAVRPVTAEIQMVTPPLVYDFAEQFIASERKFAEEMLHVTGRRTSAATK